LIVHKNPSGAVVVDTLLHIQVGQDMEQGLLGIAFHPQFAANHKYYISYTPPGSAYYDIVEERVADSTGLKDSGTPGRILIKIDDPYVNHNAGNIAFGPRDGYLYYGTGDGGNEGDPLGNGQNADGWFGKILRIDVDGKDPGLEYRIPPDNPFAQGGGRPETYAYGLRNPWRWSFDPFTGDLWLGDVGEATWEEVDIITKGGNYGWKSMEGKDGKNDGSMVLPVFTFDHAGVRVNPSGPAIIGGVVFRGNPASKYYGAYFFADYGTRRFWYLTRNAGGEAVATPLAPTPATLSAFGTDAEGRIYACGLTTGIVYHLDDPDLAPALSVRSGPGSAPDWGRAIEARPGSRLDPEAFGDAPALEVYGLAGRREAVLRRPDGRLPGAMRAGLYFLKGASVGVLRMLVVR
jgi:glucose/arabinose dehydrogenase